MTDSSPNLRPAQIAKAILDFKFAGDGSFRDYLEMTLHDLGMKWESYAKRPEEVRELSVEPLSFTKVLGLLFILERVANGDLKPTSEEMRQAHATLKMMVGKTEQSAADSAQALREEPHSCIPRDSLPLYEEESTQLGRVQIMFENLAQSLGMHLDGPDAGMAR